MRNSTLVFDVARLQLERNSCADDYRPSSWKSESASRAAGKSLTLVTAIFALIFVAGPAQAQHDCVPYTPSTAGQTILGAWDAPGEKDIYQFTAPSDPGGGYVTVSIHSAAPSSPWLTILVPGPPGSISSGSTNPAGQQNIDVVFEVAPDQIYQIEATEFLNAPIEDHPVSYELSWDFTGRADCYEPNNGRDIWPDPQSSSKEIPIDTVIEAYSLAGYVNNSITSVDDNNYDWYDFTLSEATEIWIGTVKSPADQKIKLRLFNDAQSNLLETPNPDLGGTTQAGPRLLPAGTYYLETAPFDRGASVARPLHGEPIPDHFGSTYQLIVSTQAFPECGFWSIFCDGFESSDISMWSWNNN